MKLEEIKVSYKRPEVMNQITSSKDVNEFIHNHCIQEEMSLTEHFIVMFLNRKNEVLGWKTASKGGTTGCLVDVKIIFSTALKAAAQSIIVAHNHPSVNCKPSVSDLKITSKLKDAGELLDLKLLDHVIFDHEKKSYYSFSDEGEIIYEN